MSNIDHQQSCSFLKLHRVMRSQRWLAVANGLVTFAVLIGTLGAVSSLVV
jgi:hypothetical protein